MKNKKNNICAIFNRVRIRQKIPQHKNKMLSCKICCKICWEICQKIRWKICYKIYLQAQEPVFNEEEEEQEEKEEKDQCSNNQKKKKQNKKKKFMKMPPCINEHNIDVLKFINRELNYSKCNVKLNNNKVKWSLFRGIMSIEMNNQLLTCFFYTRKKTSLKLIAARQELINIEWNLRMMRYWRSPENRQKLFDLFPKGKQHSNIKLIEELATIEEEWSNKVQKMVEAQADEYGIVRIPQGNKSAVSQWIKERASVYGHITGQPTVPSFTGLFRLKIDEYFKETLQPPTTTYSFEQLQDLDQKLLGIFGCRRIWKHAITQGWYLDEKGIEILNEMTKK